MRFWISRKSELPIREQLVRQVLLGILSEDLPPGHKLPSVRALARRHRIHANTVSAAYHALVERGWLELRRGSGLYVRPLEPSAEGQSELDRLLAVLLRAAQGKGHTPDEVLARLELLVHPRAWERILIAEQEPAMREILRAEIGESLDVPVEAPAEGFKRCEANTIVVALPTRMAKLRRGLAPEVACVPLRLNSVHEALEGESMPASDALIAIVSRSPEIRFWARTMLVSVGIDQDCLCEVDPAAAGWQDRLGLCAFAVTDCVTARALPAGCPARVFRVIADAALRQLRQLCAR